MKITKRRASLRARDLATSYNKERLGRGRHEEEDDEDEEELNNGNSESNSNSGTSDSSSSASESESEGFQLALRSSHRTTRSQLSINSGSGLGLGGRKRKENGNGSPNCSGSGVVSLSPSERNGNTNGNGTPAEENENETTHDSDWSPSKNLLLSNGIVRRSTRMRITRVENIDQSWILGGGGGAAGYPSEYSKKKASKEMLKKVKEEVGNEENDESNDVSGVNQDEEEDEEEESEEGNGQVEESSDDLYGRVKDPRRRRSSRRIINYREGCNSIASELNNQPVSRRLRDRNNLRKLSDFQVHTQSPILRRERGLLGSIRRRRRRARSSTSDSSTSDSDDYCKQQRPRRHESHKEKERNAERKTFMGDIQPLALDSSITFASVGGLDNYINKLKEIVIFPLMYKEFFKSRNIAPPRGILFHGPPGTGKTLLARALANECSVVGGKTVSFFMRKGADILNKWIGESERQLKLLFEQASINQPSIIFFDELDGLAPVRSAKTDQVHNSIVSTLLAELDGIKDRGDIIVIGATNRVDSIDPALRRPGRFDHEFPFFLPSHESRRSILNVHLKDWKDIVVPDYFVDQLADQTVGYSGADLRLLCAEANMCALRRRYPQIYKSKDKLVLDYSSVKVTRHDWDTAMTVIARSSDRSIFSTSTTGSPLPPSLRPLFTRSVNIIRERLDQVFPYRCPTMMKEPSRKRLIVFSDTNEISEHILPAVLHTMDSVPVYTLSIQSLALNEGEGKGVAMVFAEASKRSTSVIYIPSIDKVYRVLGESGQLILLNELSKTAFSPVLILASATSSLPSDLALHFQQSSIKLTKPGGKERREFFRPIFETNALQVKWVGVSAPEEILPIAPPEVKTWTPAEIAILEKGENRTITQLKIFLRDTIHKIARNKKFVEFTKPVNVEEVPDYLDIISHPMDLETMMIKVNQGVYLTKADFNKDIELIVSNALNYNPAKSQEDMRIRHRAYELRDFVFIELEEMDSDFDEKCCNIQKAREERHKLMKNTRIENVKSESSSQSSTQSESPNNQPSGSGRKPSSPRTHPFKRRRMSSWAKGITPTPKKFTKKVQITPRSPSPDRKRNASENSLHDVDHEMEEAFLEKTPVNTSPVASCSFTAMNGEKEKPDEFGFIKSNKSQLYIKDLLKLFDLTVERTSLSSLRQIIELRFQLLTLIEKHSSTHDKKELIEELARVVDKIKDKGD